MKQINPEHLRALMEMINCRPYFEHIGMKVRELGKGYSRVELDLQQEHINTFGAIHGGVYASILDAAAYWSVYCELDEDVGFTTINLSTNNLSMVSEGRILVEGRSIKVGRSMCLATSTAKDIDGNTLAYATSNLMILNDRQSLKNATDMSGRPLPAKFL